MNIGYLIAIVMLLAGCCAGGRNQIAVSKSGILEEVSPVGIKEMRGKKISMLIERFGDPDAIDSAQNYGAKFGSGIPSVVMTYISYDVRVYIANDGTILGVSNIKR